MNERRWLDRSHPQTLLNATILSYVFAVFALLGILVGGSGFIGSIAGVLCGVGGFGIANDKKWGYWLDVGATGLNVLTWLGLLVAYPGFTTVVGLAFPAILLALLLHPESRHYRRIWFR